MSIEPIKNYKDSLLGITLSFLSNIVILDVDHDVSATYSRLTDNLHSSTCIVMVSCDWNILVLHCSDGELFPVWSTGMLFS